MLRIEEITVSYGDIQAVHQFSRVISPGDKVVLSGPNGSGKSTLLKSIAGLIKPQSGAIKLDEEIITGKIDPRIGIVLQRPVMLSGTVRSNVEYGLKCRNTDKNLRQKNVTDALKTVGIEKLIDRTRTALSGGEIQRVALARTLALKPRILLLDEPFSHIDSQGADNLIHTLLKLNQSGITLIIATHDSQVAPVMGAEIIALQHGREVTPAIGNIIRGQSLISEDGNQLRLHTGQLLTHTEAVTGEVAFTLDPTAVILSRTPVASSARNVLPGRVTGLSRQTSETERDSNRIQAEIDCGFPLRVLLTDASVHELELSINSQVYLVFKASALRICRIGR